MAETTIQRPAATVMPNAALPILSRSLGSPALGTSTAVHAAVSDTGSTITITTAITNPDVPRNVTATPGGTTANVTAVSCVITGTDSEGNALTETLPAFSAGASTAVTGVKAFATITQISQPACGTSVTIAYGLGSKLGLPRRLSRDTILNTYLNGVREGTRSTVAVHASNIFSNTVSLNSALAGTPVVVDFYDAD
jgi:hypothetical protein